MKRRCGLAAGSIRKRCRSRTLSKAIRWAPGRKAWHQRATNSSSPSNIPALFRHLPGLDLNGRGHRYLDHHGTHDQRLRTRDMRRHLLARVYPDRGRGSLRRSPRSAAQGEFVRYERQICRCRQRGRGDRLSTAWPIIAGRTSASTWSGAWRNSRPSHRRGVDADSASLAELGRYRQATLVGSLIS